MKSIRTFMLNTLVLALVNIADGKLIITEIMIEPKNALDTTTQWFEVYNTENTVVALKGRVFQYCSSLTSCQDATYPSVAFIGAYGYVVFGNNDDIATNGGVATLKLPLKTMTKNGSGYNSLSAATPASTAYDDFVQWSTSLPQLTMLPFSPGVSVSRVNALFGAINVNNWKASSTLIDCIKGGDKGTPGKDNSYGCPTKAPTKVPKKDTNQETHKGSNESTCEGSDKYSDNGTGEHTHFRCACRQPCATHQAKQHCPVKSAHSGCHCTYYDTHSPASIQKVWALGARDCLPERVWRHWSLVEFVSKVGSRVLQIRNLSSLSNRSSSAFASGIFRSSPYLTSPRFINPKSQPPSWSIMKDNTAIRHVTSCDSRTVVNSIWKAGNKFGADVCGSGFAAPVSNWMLYPHVLEAYCGQIPVEHGA
jgi:hypothetical protein